MTYQQMQTAKSKTIDSILLGIEFRGKYDIP